MKKYFIFIFLFIFQTIHSKENFNEIILNKNNSFTVEYRQKYKLSCEIATLRALLKYYNFDTTEDEIFKDITFDNNPHKGFRGNKDGIQKKSFLDDYGVYPLPLKDYLIRYMNLKSDVYGNINNYSYIKNDNPLTWLKSQIKLNKPVIVWIVKHCDAISKFSKYASSNGKLYLLLYKEHTVIVIGYKEYIKAQGKNEITVFDPTYGMIFKYDEYNFMQSWSNFSYMALTIDK